MKSNCKWVSGYHTQKERERRVGIGHDDGLWSVLGNAGERGEKTLSLEEKRYGGGKFIKAFSAPR